jgi:hypothetical protein
LGGSVTRSWKRRIIELLPEWLQIVAWSSRAYQRRFGVWPNLIRPHSFNEMVQRRKVFDRDPRLPMLADKVRSKDYVRDKLGAAWVIPTLWSGKRLPPLPERNWPIPFVIKMNNGCGWNIFVRSHAECNWAEIEERCATWMGKSYGMHTGEWLYRRIDLQILIEPFMSFDQRLPLDYKFWTFHGRVEVIHVVTDREDDEKQAFFDRDWNRLACGQGFAVEHRNIPKPVSLDDMIRGAETLAADIPFVRVDFYELAGQPLFGEMTFYPGSGLNSIEPADFDRWLLELWRGNRQVELTPVPIPAVPSVS